MSNPHDEMLGRASWGEYVAESVAGALGAALPERPAQVDAGDGSTHWAGCWRDGGPAHYRCALAHIDKLDAELSALIVERGAETTRVEPVEDTEYVRVPADAVTETTRAVRAGIVTVGAVPGLGSLLDGWRYLATEEPAQRADSLYLYENVPAGDGGGYLVPTDLPGLSGALAALGKADKPAQADAGNGDGYEFVRHPRHYNSHPAGIECITVIEPMTFNIGTAIKHLWRTGLKPGADAAQDLRKAITYIEFEIARLERAQVAEGRGDA